MNWKTKAALQRIFSVIPGGNVLYTRVQKRFGQLRAGPDARLPQFERLAGLIQKNGGHIEGASFVELGTGHVINIPLCLSLCGASRVHSFDLNSRLQLDLISATIHNLIEGRSYYSEIFSKYSSSKTIATRFDLLEKNKERTLEAIAALGITCSAQHDARSMPFMDAEVDYCVSITVLEHIEPSILREILEEERRICGSQGRLVHLIDLSDHYSHADPNISSINFLKYSDRAWKIIAGNEYGYCNRLRVNNIIDIFEGAGLKVDILDCIVDERGIKEIETGFSVNSNWKDCPSTELCTTQVDIVATEALTARSNSDSLPPA